MKLMCDQGDLFIKGVGSKYGSRQSVVAFTLPHRDDSQLGHLIGSVRSGSGSLLLEQNKSLNDLMSQHDGWTDIIGGEDASAVSHLPFVQMPTNRYADELAFHAYVWPVMSQENPDRSLLVGIGATNGQSWDRVGLKEDHYYGLGSHRGMPNSVPDLGKKMKIGDSITQNICDAGMSDGNGLRPHGTMNYEFQLKTNAFQRKIMELGTQSSKEARREEYWSIFDQDKYYSFYPTQYDDDQFIAYLQHRLIENLSPRESVRKALQSESSTPSP